MASDTTTLKHGIEEDLTPRNEIEFRDTAAKGIFLSGFCLIIVGLVVELLALLPKLIFYDVLYFSNRLRFSLEMTPFWQVIGALYLAVGLGSMIFAIIYRRRVPGSRLRAVAHVIAIIHICLPPVAAFFGVVLWVQLKRTTAPPEEKETVQAEEKEDTELPTIIKAEIGKMTFWGAGIHLIFLFLLFMLTVYLSTVMLDMTYPFLTMRVILWIRIGLGIFAGIFVGQIAFGILYRTYYRRRVVRGFAYFYGIIQFLFFPLGTYLGATLLRDLRYDLALEKKRAETISV